MGSEEPFSVPPPLVSPTSSGAQHIESLSSVDSSHGDSIPVMEEPTTTDTDPCPLGSIASTACDDDEGRGEKTRVPPVAPSATAREPKKAPKKGAATASKRSREVEDTAAADSRAAFRHSQRLLRKSASSVDLKSALHRSFSQQHSPITPSLCSPFPAALSCDSQAAVLNSPMGASEPSKAPVGTGSSSVHDITQRFLSKVQEQKQHTIRTLVSRRELVASTAASQKSVRNDGDEEEELIVNNVSTTNSRQVSSLSAVPSAKSAGVNHLRSSNLSSPLFAALEDSRSSGSQLSPTYVHPDEHSTPLHEHDEGDTNDLVVGKHEDSLISALQRKHELLKFKKQQQQQIASASQQGNSIVIARSTSSSSSAVAAASKIPTPTLLQRSLLNTFHVSTTDVSFLKRTNSFENSQSQSIVFRKENSAHVNSVS